MYFKMIEGRLTAMPLNGVDENGCLFVISHDCKEYADNNGYKMLITAPCPEDDNEYEIKYTEDDINIYQEYKLKVGE